MPHRLPKRRRGNPRWLGARCHPLALAGATGGAEPAWDGLSTLDVGWRNSHRARGSRLGRGPDRWAPLTTRTTYNIRLRNGAHSCGECDLDNSP